MVTPLIIVGLLIMPYLIFSILGAHLNNPSFGRLGGVLGLSIAFVFFGIGHFVMTEEMTWMLPPWLPHRAVLIYLTGLVEFSLALALLVPALRRIAGSLCIVILIIFFPANVYAAINHVDFGGHVWGPIYLIVRAPLQILLIAWAYWFAVRWSALNVPVRSDPCDKEY